MTVAFAWTTAEGVTVPLDETIGAEVAAGVLGLDAAPITLNVSDRVAGAGGSLVNRRNPPRPLDIPFELTHATSARRVVSQLAAMFQGPGVLTFTDGDHTRTLRDVVYAGGLEGDEPALREYRTVVVSLLALDPIWYGQAESVEVALNVSSTAWNAAGVAWNAAIPWNGGASRTLSITGDVEARPRFVFTGPLTTASVGFGHVQIELVRALAAGEVVEVDTRFGARGPHLGSDLVPDSPVGLVDWSLLSERSRLFGLPAGLSSIVFGATGTDANSELLVSWEPRWLTP